MANFFVKTVTVSMFYQAVSQWHSLHFELLIELVAQKLTELWRLKIWSIFWPGDLVPWPTNLSMSHTGTAHPFYMWTKFGDDMSKRSWVMLDKTDRQTDRQMKGQSEIAYLPKFADLYVKLKRISDIQSNFIHFELLIASLAVITKKGHFSFIREYRGTISRSSCDVIDDVITMKISFLA